MSDIVTCVDARNQEAQNKERRSGGMFNERKFKAQLVLNGVSMKELAQKMGINESTLYRKIKQDGSFTRDEINQMISILNIDDPKEIFFTEELA